MNLYSKSDRLCSISFKESRTSIPSIFNLILLPSIREIMLPFSQTTITLPLLTCCSIGGYDIFWEVPSRRFTWWNVHQVHGIDLLEGLAIGFDQEEVDEQSGAKIASSEDISVRKIDLIGDEGCEEGKVEVEELCLTHQYKCLPDGECGNNGEHTQLLALQNAIP